MEKLKICFVGIGSIAQRHIKNLSHICHEKRIDLKIDAFRRHSYLAQGIDHVYTDLSDVPSDYDIIFITNPTKCHLNTLKQFHDKGKHFFIEKPVVSLDQIAEARQIELKNNAVYYVACPLRYNAVIRWVKDNLEPADIISVRSISSSYLPDWRPGQDYRKTYSAHKSFGGGVSIDLIHEWDYLTSLFGWPLTIHSFIGKKSNLEIDSDDYAIYIAEYKNMIAELHLDYFGRNPIREIEIFTKNDTIIGDIIHSSIIYMKSGKQIHFNEGRDDYQKRELLYFLDMIEGNNTDENRFMHAIDLLDLSQGKTVKNR